MAMCTYIVRASSLPRQIMAKNKKRDAAGSQENSRKRKKVDATPATELKADNDGELPDIVVPEQREGRPYVLGMGDCAQLGLGEEISEKSRPGPVTLPGDEKAVAVAAGGMHTVCLTASGKIFTWGVNDEGALGRYTEGEAWKNSGFAKGKPQDSYTPGVVNLPADAQKIVALSAGDSHTLVLDIKGAIFGWGTFRDGSGVMGFAPGQRIAVKPMQVWEPTAQGNQVMALDSGTDHAIALCRNGNVLTFGNGAQGQLGRFGARRSSRTHTTIDTFLVPQTMHLPLGVRQTFPVAVAAGWYTSYVVYQNGAVYACGMNNYKQLACGLPDNCVMVPKHATDLQNVKVVSVHAGEHHALVITEDGDLMSFGRPAYGRLGQKDVDVNSDEGVGIAKVEVEGLEGPVGGAAAGSGVSGCFSAQMCGLWMCGFGVNSQLGQGDDDSDLAEMTRVKRTKVFNEVEITQLQIGGQHVVMLAVPTEPPTAVKAAAKTGESAGKGSVAKGKGKMPAANVKDAAKSKDAAKAEEDVAEQQESEKPAEDDEMDDGEGEDNEEEEDNGAGEDNEEEADSEEGEDNGEEEDIGEAGSNLPKE